MSIPRDRLSVHLTRWRRGDAITARKLNQPIDAILRLHGGVQPPRQVRSRVEQAGTLQQFKVVREDGDYVWCEKQSGSPESDGGGAQYRVAKPYLLRRTPFEGTDAGGEAKSRNGITFEYSSDYERTATKTASGQTEDQVIVPSYVTGDVIYATRDVTGGTGVFYTNGEGGSVAVKWLDVNADGRAWGQA